MHWIAERITADGGRMLSSHRVALPSESAIEKVTDAVYIAETATAATLDGQNIKLKRE